MDANLSVQTADVNTQADSARTQITARDLYHYDPLLVLFRDALHLNTVAGTIVVVTGVLVTTAGVLFGLATFAGTTFDLGPSFGNTIRALLQTLIFPAFAGIYLLLPDAIATLFNTLENNGVIGAYRRGSTPMTYASFVQKLVTWLNSSWWSVLALVIIALLWLYRLLVIEPQIIDTSSHAHLQYWLRITILILYSPMLYCLFLSIIRIIIALVFSNWLFHAFTMKINPLHPDGYAGLGALGTLLIISSVMMAAMAIAAMVMNSSFLLSNDNIYSRAEAISLALLYLMLAPSLLLGWILLPHHVMQEARDAVLQPLANEFQAALVDTLPKGKEDAAALKAETDRLEELKRRYELIQQTYPTWPLAIENVRRLAATITLPALIPILLPLFASLFGNLGHLFNLPLK
ncbi:MAG: hypothetical protein ACJ795_06455 [Ktedonobacteraceae bacterium]